MNQESKINLNRTREFGDLFTDCFTYVRQHYKTLGKSILYFVIPVIVLSSIFFGSYMQQIFNLMPAGSEPSFSSITPAFTSLGAAALFGMFAWAAMSAVVYNHMSLLSESDSTTVTVNKIWGRFKEDILGLIGISLLTGIFTFFGVLFLIIPGIYLSVKFALIPAAFVHERVGIGDAFSRSWFLTNNFWWITFGLIILMSMMVSFMSYFLTVPIMIASAFAQFAGGEIGSEQSMFAIMYGSAMLLGYIFYALFYITLGLHYFNLVERKEGNVMQQRIEQINPETSA